MLMVDDSARPDTVTGKMVVDFCVVVRSVISMKDVGRLEF